MATGHRSYQPVHACGSKLLQKKWDQTYYEEHRRMVRTAKPMVDSSTPRQFPHIVAKQKKQQLQRERQDEIERANLSLLTKMQHTMDTKGAVDHHSTYRHHSLNDVKRQRELERVAKENKAMLSRLQQVEPQYRVSDWIEDFRRSEVLTGRITAYPSQHSAPAGRRSSASQHGKRSKSSHLSEQPTSSAGRAEEGEGGEGAVDPEGGDMAVCGSADKVKGKEEDGEGEARTD